jgi:hypothetical protein
MKTLIFSVILVVLGLSNVQAQTKKSLFPVNDSVGIYIDNQVISYVNSTSCKLLGTISIFNNDGVTFVNIDFPGIRQDIYSPYLKPFLGIDRNVKKIADYLKKGKKPWHFAKKFYKNLRPGGFLFSLLFYLSKC